MSVIVLSNVNKYYCFNIVTWFDKSFEIWMNKNIFFTLILKMRYINKVKKGWNEKKEKKEERENEMEEKVRKKEKDRKKIKKREGKWKKIDEREWKRKLWDGTKEKESVMREMKR